MSETWLPWLIDGLVLLGLSIMSVVVFGVFRLPDVYGQLHTASKAVVLGVVPKLPSVALLGDATITVRALLIGVFILLTTPLSAHAIGQAALQRGEPMHGVDSIDETGQRGRRPKKKKAEE